MGPYEPLWAHMGPARALEEREKVKKMHPFFKYHIFLRNRRFWPPDNVFWWKNRVLQVSGRDTLENAIKITSKTKFSTHFVQISSHLHPALSYSLHSISKQISSCVIFDATRPIKKFDFWVFILFWSLWFYVFGFFVSKPRFLDSSTQNHAGP